MKTLTITKWSGVTVVVDNVLAYRIIEGGALVIDGPDFCEVYAAGHWIHLLITES